MRLADPLWCLGILLLPGLYWLFTRRQKGVRVTFPVPLSAAWAAPRRDRARVALKLLALAGLLAVLARPQTGSRHLDRKVQSVDLLLLLDVSASMAIEDLGEGSRLEIAKQTLRNFIQSRPHDRLGLTIFSGEGLTLVPPTLDGGVLLQALNQVQINTLREGTAIGDGLAIGVSHLRFSQAKSRVIVLLTDGDNNTGQIDPLTAGDLAKGYGIKVYTLAVGTEGPVKMPVEVRTAFGQTIKTYEWMEQTLNPKLLQEIATRTEGKFYRVTNEKALESVFKEIDQLEKTEVSTQERLQYEEYFQPFLIALGFFLLGLQIWEWGLWRWAL